LRQRDAIAPLLFMLSWKLQLEDVIQKHGEPYLPNVVKLCYMLMMLLLGRRLQDVEVFMSLVKQTNKMGLEMNGKKQHL
jgi:hypothetical protein